MTSCIVVQVRNGDEYIAGFLAHHLRLVDEIILIDHNSVRDLRPLGDDGKVKVFRFCIEHFAKEHFINYVIDAYKIKERFDFVFLLDIDEFLPFKNKLEIKDFFLKHKEDAVVAFNWRNGFIGSGNALDSNTDLYFCKKQTTTRKLVYNARRSKRFFPLEGNHNAKYSMLQVFYVQARPIRCARNLGLLHLPFLDIQGLRRKITENPATHFADKINAHVSHLNLAAGVGWLDSSLDSDEMLQIVANYRTNRSEDVMSVGPEDFEKIDLFSHLRLEIEVLASCISKVPAGTGQPTRSM